MPVLVPADATDFPLMSLWFISFSTRQISLPNQQHWIREIHEYLAEALWQASKWLCRLWLGGNLFHTRVCGAAYTWVWTIYSCQHFRKITAKNFFSESSLKNDGAAHWNNNISVSQDLIFIRKAENIVLA